VNTLEQVILTLQYCLETFEQACRCGNCDPCTNGQRDIRTAIRTVNVLLSGTAANRVYILERPSARAEFVDHSALVKFVRELAGVASLISCPEPSLDEIAAMAARNSWHLFELPKVSKTRTAPDRASRVSEYASLETMVSAHQLISYPSENGRFNTVYEEAKSFLERYPSMDELYVVQYSQPGGAPEFASAVATQISERGPFYLTDICAVVRQ